MEEKKPSSNGNFGFAVFIIAMVGLILYAKGIIVLPNKQEDVKPYVVTVETDSVTNIDTDSDDFNNIEPSLDNYSAIDYILNRQVDFEIKRVDLEDIELAESVGIEEVESEVEVIEKHTYTTADYSTVDNCYYFNHLASDEQVIYMEILTGLKGLQETFEVSSYDVDQVDKLKNMVLYDHSEIFYMTELAYYYFDNVNAYKIKGMKGIELRPVYNFTAEEILSYQQQIDAVCDSWLSQVETNVDDYTKVQQIFEILVNNVDYDVDAENNQNIISVFLNRKTVCNGYASAMTYMLNKIGIESTRVTGTVIENNMPHAWNIVKEGDTYYYVDSTWGNSQFLGEDNIKHIQYVYANMTTNELKKTHIIDNEEYLPQCIDESKNYFRKNNLYCEDIDSAKKLCSKLSQLNAKVSIQFANSSLYQDAKNHLITQDEIYDCYSWTENTQLSYIEDEVHNIMTIIRVK